MSQVEDKEWIMRIMNTTTCISSSHPGFPFFYPVSCNASYIPRRISLVRRSRLASLVLTTTHNEVAQVARTITRTFLQHRYLPVVDSTMSIIHDPAFRKRRPSFSPRIPRDLIRLRHEPIWEQSCLPLSMDVCSGNMSILGKIRLCLVVESGNGRVLPLQSGRMIRRRCRRY